MVEHLDPELGPWSALEYAAIAKESHQAGATFCLTSVSKELVLPEDLKQSPGLKVETESVEVLFAEVKPRTCLLDPAAKVELTPEDGEHFDVFLFGGILGTCIDYRVSRVYRLIKSMSQVTIRLEVRRCRQLFISNQHSRHLQTAPQNSARRAMRAAGWDQGR